MNREKPKIKSFDFAARLMTAVLVALTVIEYFFAPHYRPVFPWHEVTGYMGMIGFGSCLVVVFVTKWVGKRLLQRPEAWDERD